MNLFIFVRFKVLSNQLQLIKMTQQYNKWTNQQDSTLIELVKRYGTKKWKIISKEMKNNYKIFKRNGKQCRQRWMNQLNPENLNKKWTTEDHQKLIIIQKELGTKWIEISKHFPGRYFCYNLRTDSNIKNEFYAVIKKAIRKMCRFVKIRTSSMNIYSIRPSTLSQIFAQRDPNTQFCLQISQLQSVHRKTLYKHAYSEIKKIISYFIFSHIYQQNLEAKPSQYQVFEVLNQLMKINSSFCKSSSSDSSLGQPYPDNQLQNKAYYKSMSLFTSLKYQQKDDKLLGMLKYKSQNMRRSDQQSISEGIFSSNLSKKKISMLNQNTNSCPLYKSVYQFNFLEKIQNNDSYYFDVKKIENSTFNYSNYLKINISQEMMNDLISYLPAWYISASPKTSKFDDILDQYIQQRQNDHYPPFYS